MSDTLTLPAGLSAEDTATLTALAARVTLSAREQVRTGLEDAAVRMARAQSWCDEFRNAAIRVIGNPTGPRVGYRLGEANNSRAARREFRDLDGLDCAGFDVNGWQDGYGPDGFNAEGRDREGYDRETGLNPDGLFKWRFAMDGYDRDGFNAHGMDRDGYDRKGFNRNGYDRDGLNADGFNRYGQDKDGFDSTGFNGDGIHRDGLDRYGRDPYRFGPTGYDKDGYGRDGWHRDQSVRLEQVSR